MIMTNENKKYLVVLGGIVYEECESYEDAQDMLEQLKSAINA